MRLLSTYPTLVMPRSWTHLMVLGQQFKEFQKYETSLRGEETVCRAPGKMSVLYVDIQRGEMAVSLFPSKKTVLELLRPPM